MNETYQRMVGYYQEGHWPWDSDLPPPEVIAVMADLPVGRALDLGSGLGRAARYMAQRGWQVEAVDFVPQAIEIARSRSAEFSNINYHVGSIIELDFLEPGFDFALDVGCGHSLDSADLPQYRDHLLRLLKPQALFLLYGRLRSPDMGADGPSGFDESALLTTFQQGFELSKVERGETTMGENIWKSAWYWFVRSAE
ncbi:MAG TPA: class I SAM-dependent methyltransferase [Anaerolineae bacterium]|nr:class I SAM-dependent methyltransferase [Anaerolineae bacterium]